MNTRHRRHSTAGLTLVELMLAVVLLIGGGAALLLGIHYAMIHADYLRQAQFAMNQAQGRLEQLEAMDFTTLPAQAGTAVIATFPGDPTAIMATQVQPPGGSTTLLDLHVAVCWKHRNRQIGEVNGAVVCQDGADANWWVDSPVMVSTRVATRQ